MQAQRVADVVEAEAVSELRVEQTDHMAPGTERARLIFHARPSCQLRRQMRWNEVAKLPQQGDLAAVGLFRV